MRFLGEFLILKIKMMIKLLFLAFVFCQAKANPGKAMEILEPYIKNRLTIALKADNGRYLSVVDDYYVGISWWVRPIEAFKKTKDHSCQFYINQVWGHSWKDFWPLLTPPLFVDNFT